MGDPKSSLRVFISYARRDCAAFAEELLAGLEATGFEPFLDRHDIAAGEDWEARLGGLIQSSDTVVFVISPASMSSERCDWEVKKAESLSKRIIPVVAIDVPEGQTPTGLKRLNYIFFSQGHSFARGLGELKKALSTDLGWIREHTRLGELAARWRARGGPEEMLLRGSELEAAKAWLATWEVPAPEPTELHRVFVGESEGAEANRFADERKRLDEITAAQTGRERALKRMRRSTMVFALLLVVLAGLAGSALYIAYRQLHERDRALAESQTRIVNAGAALETLRANLQVVQSQLADRDTSDRSRAEELESIRRQLAVATTPRLQSSSPVASASNLSPGEAQAPAAPSFGGSCNDLRNAAGRITDLGVLRQLRQNAIPCSPEVTQAIDQRIEALGQE